MNVTHLKYVFLDVMRYIVTCVKITSLAFLPAEIGTASGTTTHHELKIARYIKGAFWLSANRSVADPFVFKLKCVCRIRALVAFLSFMTVIRVISYLFWNMINIIC